METWLLPSCNGHLCPDEFELVGRVVVFAAAAGGVGRVVDVDGGVDDVDGADGGIADRVGNGDGVGI